MQSLTRPIPEASNKAPMASKQGNPSEGKSREAATLSHSVTLKIAQKPSRKFKWQMVFNAYDMERHANGVLVRVGFVNHGMLPEIVAIFVSNEGIRQLEESSAEYITGFVSPPIRTTALPPARQFPPLFSNYVSLAKSGSCAEISFYTILLHDIAQITRKIIPSTTEVTPVEVALLHSDLKLHEQFVMELLGSIQS